MLAGVDNVEFYQQNIARDLNSELDFGVRAERVATRVVQAFRRRHTAFALVRGKVRLANAAEARQGVQSEANRLAVDAGRNFQHRGGAGRSRADLANTRRSEDRAGLLRASGRAIFVDDLGLGVVGGLVRGLVLVLVLFLLGRNGSGLCFASTASAFIVFCLFRRANRGRILRCLRSLGGAVGGEMPHLIAVVAAHLSRVDGPEGG